uniref:Uncharacterized protein n=1 Tax=Anguilla anguilla TaxID=7936 RepID=A0A0E9QY24_ANGAN
MTHSINQSVWLRKNHVVVFSGLASLSTIEVCIILMMCFCATHFHVR